jgi:transcriptional regulator with XRE-family HTH domain
MTDKPDNKWISLSDRAIAENIGKFIQDQRLKQTKTQAELSKSAGISRSTLSLLERGETVTLPTLIQVLRQLNCLYTLNQFMVQPSLSPIALAKMETKKRKRVRNASNQTKNTSDW